MSSVFTEQSQTCVKNMKPFIIQRGNPLWEGNRVSHSYQAWSRQTCLSILMTVFTNIFYWSNTENELKSYHNKTNWVEFVGIQDSECSCRWTEFHDEGYFTILTNPCSGLSWVHFAKRWRNIWTKKLDQRKQQNFAPIGSYNMMLVTKYGVEIGSICLW